jgi:hypothetical protein
MIGIDDIQRELADLPAEDLACVREYIAYLKWRARSGLREPAADGAGAWQYNLVEHFGSASVRSSEHEGGMEVKAAEATVGGERRPALLAHPPISGEAQVEFVVPIPAGLSGLALQFAIGIRDGPPPEQERLVAFRVRVGGFQVWSRAARPTRWSPAEIALPLQAGDALRLTLATDGLGDHHWAWAAWGEPMLVGMEESPAPGRISG